LDEWIRRRLRCYRLKQRKRRYGIATWLQQQGVTERNAWKVAMSDKGWWHLALTPQGLLLLDLVSVSSRNVFLPSRAPAWSI
ncbi:hypothetical protein FCV55_21260, partial [Vibrio sp. F13]